MTPGHKHARGLRLRAVVNDKLEQLCPPELGSAAPARGERRPAKISGWREHRRHAAGALETLRENGVEPIALSAWTRHRVFALSTLELAELPDGSGEVGQQWHISFSVPGRGRCTDVEVQQALACFGLTGAEEDNHHPGVARHFWMPVDPARRRDCECKATEVVVEEPDGYRWSNSREPDECRGCELAELTGMPCPIHAAGAP